jgi:hypothetical protein
MTLTANCRVSTQRLHELTVSDTKGSVVINLHHRAVAVKKKMAEETKQGSMKRNRSWFALVALCATPALAAAMGLALLFAGGAVAFAGVGEPVGAATQGAVNPAERMFAGLITDDQCRARHEMDSGMSATECARMCVRNGARYILVEGEKRYALAGRQDELDGLAGQRANIAGTLDGNTITISSISSGH